jgi:hypothetical protein
MRLSYPTTAFTNSILSREVVKGNNAVPVKLYNFKSSLDVFPSTLEIRKDLLEMMGVLKHRSFSADDYKYAIAMAWGYKQKCCDKTEEPIKAFDIFSFKFDKPWNECNPEVDVCCLKNLSADRSVMCETGTIILGEEGKFRRTTKDLEDYLSSWPSIGELGPVRGP